MYPHSLQQCPFPHPICKLYSINFFADFPPVLHPHRFLSGSLKHLAGSGKPHPCDKTRWPQRNCCHRVCWRQEGPGRPTNHLWQLAECWKYWHTSRATWEPWPTGLPQSLPWATSIARTRLQGHSGRRDKDILILIVFCTRLALTLGFKSLLCLSSSAASTNPGLLPFSQGRGGERGQKFGLSSLLCLTHGNPFKVTP